MKKIFKYLFSILLDCVVVLIISLFTAFVSDNTIGTIIPSSIIDFENAATTFTRLSITTLIIAFLYVTIAIVHKKSIGFMLTNRETRHKSIALVLAKAIDLFVIVTITLLVNLVLQHVFYIDGFITLFIVILLYGIICTISKGRTIGLSFLGFRLADNHSKHGISLRLALKYGVGVILLDFLFIICGISEPYAIFMDIAYCHFVLLIVSFLLFGTSLWNHICKLHFERQPISSIKNIGFCVGIILFSAIGFLTIKSINNKQHPHSEKILGFNFPYEFPEYQNEKNVKPYVDCLQNQQQTPKDYILSLFDDYDIVILQENIHGEASQWELISDIVKDSVFIHNVGHVFTEYGSAMHQDKINRFLLTSFDNDTALEKETAVLMDYMSGGFYYFIKGLNILNATLPDSLKVQEHYTDCIDWDHFTTLGRNQITEDMNRDSLMAEVVIKWYNQQCKENKRHKLLLVTNGRHAYGYAGGKDKVTDKCYDFRHLNKGNQGQYIWAKFPDRTSTVMQMGFNTNRMIYLPLYREIKKGIWSKAYQMTNARPVGFNLQGTPFGEDHVEDYPLKGGNTELRYADLFTGIIFNRPYMELTNINHPYQKYAVYEEAKRKGITDTALISQKTSYLTDEGSSSSSMFWAVSISMSNFLPIICFLLLMVFSVISYLIFTLRHFFNKNLK